jgi:cephalosporin-C deacetylase
MESTHFNHGYNFDPSCGMNLEQLLAVEPPPSPPDFAAFWERRYAEALTTTTNPHISSSVKILNRHTVHELHYTSSGGVEIGGWLLIPEDGKVHRALIIGHGYGGRDSPDTPDNLKATVLVFPCFRGLGCSPIPEISPDPYSHVLHEIQNRDRYIIGGCVDDLWLAVSVALDLFPETAGHIGYSGISFGGGIGMLAAPWDSRIRRLQLQVPTFGHQALRLTLPCAGSGEAVRNFQRQHNLNLMETLAYYDAATAACFLRIPALVAAARFDPVVPPPGQFAIYNAIPANLRRLFVLDAGHFDYPFQAEQLQNMYRERANFFTEL